MVPDLFPFVWCKIRSECFQRIFTTEVYDTPAVLHDISNKARETNFDKLNLNLLMKKKITTAVQKKSSKNEI